METVAAYLRHTALFVNVMAAVHGRPLAVQSPLAADVYTALAGQLIGSKQRSVLLVDWSDMDECKRHFLLRASVPLEGQALPTPADCLCPRSTPLRGGRRSARSR
jgi:hypothetical protein